MIVRRGYVGMSEKSEEEFLLGTRQIAPESLGRFETKHLFAEVVQFSNGVFFDLGGLCPGNLAGVEFFSHMAESGAEVDEAVAERTGTGVLFFVRQEGMFPSDLLGVGDEMGEADLPDDSNPVIGGIAIAH